MIIPRLTYVVARVLIASVFVGLGVERLLAGAHILSDRAVASPLWNLLFTFEAVAGLLIMLGWQAGRIALIMAVFLAVDAFRSHPFWNYGGNMQHEQLLQFLKNVSAIGGLLLVSWIEGHEFREPNP
ncbi:hypothetical protein [Luteolibacter sp. Populi]|uniref:hypothetical protein n=1 Tax=Luteolibacter sp. Populi TaxID=3230487 RepID=UPI003465C720